MRLPTLALSLLFIVTVPTAARGEDHDHSHGHHAEELEEFIVQATRSRRCVQDEPMRVEVLAGEEVEEKLLMRPGNISMMLHIRIVFSTRTH